MVRKSKSESKATAPATKTTAPATKTTAPATKTTAPATKTTAPATKNTTPATKNVVSNTESLEVVEQVNSDSLPASELVDSFHEFVAKLQTVCGMMQALKADFKNLEKKCSRELKQAQKAASKKKRKTGNRQPSGFVKPTLISTELASFLGRPEGTEMARTEVTREINKYIREHDLQDKENGRKINADKALSSLLKLGDADELTYFNLQKYMSPHFAKAGQSVVSN